MLATTVAPVANNGGSSSASHVATPGPWRPTELSMPAGVSWTRGGGLPAHGSTDSDFTTTAPRPARSTCRASSSPWPAVPDAVITGWRSATDPTVVAMSVMD